MGRKGKAACGACLTGADGKVILAGMMRGKGWSRDELLLAFRLYCRTPFGRLHSRNPEIVELAKQIGRTPGSVAMKACNFASLDPAQQARGIRGLKGASEADRALFAEFLTNSESIAAAAEAAAVRVTGQETAEAVLEMPTGPTEVTRTVQARRVQGFFRSAVLAAYENRCAISGLAVPELLNASHIIPWAESVERRADPRNGICLNALYDRAFYRGLITFDDNLRVMVSPKLKKAGVCGEAEAALIGIEGRPLKLPARFEPDREAMKWHRQRAFAHAS